MKEYNYMPPDYERRQIKFQLPRTYQFGGRFPHFQTKFPDSNIIAQTNPNHFTIKYQNFNSTKVLMRYTLKPPRD